MIHFQELYQAFKTMFYKPAKENPIPTIEGIRPAANGFGSLA